MQHFFLPHFQRIKQKKLIIEFSLFMRKLVLVLSAVIFTSVLVSAQTRLTGFVKVAESETPLPGVTVTLLNQNIPESD